MSQSPQRPYVPHRTPTRAQPALSLADFAVTRPFVPGAEQARDAIFEAGAPAAVPSTETSPASQTAVPSIESFLAEAISTTTSPIETADDLLGEEPDELPPLEHFLDPLPPISDFAANDEPGDDWVATDWQRYDWQSVASLGEPERAQDEASNASNAWATTDWEVPAPRRRERSQAPADAIATALDQIVQRLRNGDLSLPGGGVADPATIAATLAALLGVRR